VKCSGTPWVPRYVRTGSQFRITSEGWVEIKHGSTWRPISSHYFWDNDYGARLVCENVGYGNGKRTKTRNPHNRSDFDTRVGHRRCAASNTNIFQCRKHGGPNQGDKSAQANVKCWGAPWKRQSFGKVGGEFALTGRSDGWVFRKHSGVWRPISSHYFWDNNYGAEIVCRSLGFGTGVRTKTRNSNNRELFDTQVGHRRCASNSRSIL
jgi:hypothetical protein